jgi:hypothetical protein
VESGHLSLGLPQFSFLFQVLPLVAVSLSFSKPQLHLDPPLLEIKLETDQGESLLQGGLRQLEDFLLVEEQLARAFGLVLKKCPRGLPRLDVASIEPAFATLNAGK